MSMMIFSTFVIVTPATPLNFNFTSIQNEKNILKQKFVITAIYSRSSDTVTHRSSTTRRRRNLARSARGNDTIISHYACRLRSSKQSFCRSSSSHLHDQYLVYRCTSKLWTILTILFSTNEENALRTNKSPKCFQFFPFPYLMLFLSLHNMWTVSISKMLVIKKGTFKLLFIRLNVQLFQKLFIFFCLLNRLDLLLGARNYVTSLSS